LKVLFLFLKPSLTWPSSIPRTKFDSGAPDEVLARLPEFIRLFLSDGLLPDLVYVLGLKNV